MEFEQFKMNKVKLLNNKVNVVYEVNEPVGQDVIIKKQTIEVNKTPHPDLPAELSNLKKAVGQFIGLTKDKYSKINVIGITTGGEDEKEWTIATFILEVAGGYKTCINTPKVNLFADVIGIEKDFAEATMRLKEEVYAYLFENKVSQTEMDFEEEKEELVNN